MAYSVEVSAIVWPDDSTPVYDHTGFSTSVRSNPAARPEAAHIEIELFCDAVYGEVPESYELTYNGQIV